MSFLLNNESEYISARITNYGRKKVAEGNFNIKYFQVGDSEFDYNFHNLNGATDLIPSQKVFSPLDKDSLIKYPYKLSESSVTGTTFGIPVKNSEVTTIKNNVGAAGFVSNFIEYNGTTGTTIVCDSTEINISRVNGSKYLIVNNDFDFTNSDYITILFTRLYGPNKFLTRDSNSLVFKIINATPGALTTTLELDREMPDLSSSLGTISVISNKCNPFYPDGYDYTYDCEPLPQDISTQQEPWTMNIVWGKKPAGSDSPAKTDEELTGYTSNVYVSIKQHLGYTNSDGQIYNDKTTYVNSFNEEIIVPPEEQHSIAILHYSESNNVYEPERHYKYEDYIGHVDEEDINYFEVYIPFLYYHRNTGTTIGARFFMDSTDYYIDSAASDTKLYKLKFRYLIDENNIKVGKIFIGKKIIVFDDQEIVAALDYKSNRKHTLPVPRVTQVGTDYNYNINDYSLMNGTSGQTLYVSYLFQYIFDDNMNGLHCNQYAKITGTTLSCDVSLKFNEDEFRFMKDTFSNYRFGFIADRFYVLAQLVEEGEELEHDSWVKMDFTEKIPNHSVGDLIDPENLRDVRFVITYSDYNDGDIYNVDDFLQNLPKIGDEQPFPGSVKLTRASDLQVLNFLVNLPEGEFTTTQNPTWESEKDKRITEVGLLDENKEFLVIGKLPYPVKRVGTQVLAVKLDF